VHDRPQATTFLFTDIEGSTRLWELEAERMRPALAHHDAIARSAVESHRGQVVKMTGDGVHAAFDDPLDAIHATLELQHALADCLATHGIDIKVRCGMHMGTDQRRDGDFFGTAVNRAARIMSTAHGGQMLLSQAVAQSLGDRLPKDVSLRDLGAVRLRDLGSPERVFQVVHPLLRRDFPALRSLEKTPNNLPHEVTSFVGRERELLQIGKLLAGCRLLTITGMGGLGKTRLSLHVAAEMMDDYPDGVWLVELAPLRDPSRVPLAVALALGVKEEAGRPVAEALVKYVKDRALLLVLDNCEHLLQPCAALARQLLASGAQVKILASSREPLRVTGETTFPLAALPVPDLRAPFEPGVLAQNDSARLFIERAVAVMPDFEVDGPSATAIAAICHRLDGIPLALELAAARVRSLPVQKIVERLADRFNLLKGGDPTALPRQQTLRALIDWSYDLLTGAERLLLRQLAVFAGGWTLEAAEAVCACDDEEVIDLLGRLAEKSLVVVEAHGERYRLLETVREYAQSRNALSSDAHAVHDRHLAYFVDFTDRAKLQLVGPEQGTWLTLLDAERENILAAHAWVDQSPGNAMAGLRLANSAKRYWTNRGLLELGIRVTTEALAREGARERDMERCRGLFNAGQLRYLTGQYREARACLEESLSIARELNDANSISAVLQPLGMAAAGEGDLATARAYLEEAVALTRKGGNRQHLAGAMNSLAQLHALNGHLDEAEPLFTAVVGLARESDDRESIAIGLINLAMVSIVRDAGKTAGEFLGEAFDIADRIQSNRVGQSLLEATAGLATIREDWPAAARLYGAAEAEARRSGLRRDPADEAFLAPLIDRARAALGSDGFRCACAGGHAMPLHTAVPEARERLPTYR
jgi:predicted ATPase/class 3 adenylate cyclase